MKGKKLRPLHLPSPVSVRADDRGRPTAVGSTTGATNRSTTGSADSSRRAGLKRVVQVREIWRIDDEWWRDPVTRLYFDVVLEDGERTILYRDLADGRWYRQ